MLIKGTPVSRSRYVEILISPSHFMNTFFDRCARWYVMIAMGYKCYLVKWCDEKNYLHVSAILVLCMSYLWVYPYRSNSNNTTTFLKSSLTTFNHIVFNFISWFHLKIVYSIKQVWQILLMSHYPFIPGIYALCLMGLLCVYSSQITLTNLTLTTQSLHTLVCT